MCYAPQLVVPIAISPFSKTLLCAVKVMEMLPLMPNWISDDAGMVNSGDSPPESDPKIFLPTFAAHVAARSFRDLYVSWILQPSCPVRLTPVTIPELPYSHVRMHVN